MKIKSAAVIGAGAIGSYIVWGLSKKDLNHGGDIDFCVVAEGKRKARLEKDGLVINGEEYHPAVKTPDEAHGVDVLFVTVKTYALQAALEDIKAVCDSHTLVLSLMNGVDSEELIAGKLGGYDQIMNSLIKIASERVGNSIKFNAETTVGMIYGETVAYKGARPDGGSDRTDALKELFDGTGLHFRVSDCIMSEIWAKFRLNVQNNQPQAMINCGTGAYRDSEHVIFLQQKLREEVTKIAEAKGIDISRALASSGQGSPVKDRARYSTLQDLDAKRHTEVDSFAGTVVRMGKELGIETPYNEFTYHVIKALEEKNDGRFDYE